MDMDAPKLMDYVRDQFERLAADAAKDAKPIADSAKRCSVIMAAALVDHLKGNLDATSFRGIADRLALSLEVRTTVEAHRQYEKRLEALLQIGIGALKLALAAV